jgi:hypothetical protein
VVVTDYVRTLVLIGIAAAEHCRLFGALRLWFSTHREMRLPANM